jgi:hypothetical protein
MTGKPTHVFIVGLGRSGTKFLQNVLTASSELHISAETHFFSELFHKGFIRTAKSIGEMKKDENVRELVDRMFSNRIFGTMWRTSRLKSKEKILERFLASDRSFRSFFEIILDEDRLQNQKIIGGEKTPSHLFHVSTLLDWFPNAKVIQIIRNPKDVLASEVTKKVKPDYPLKKKNFFYNLGLFLSVAISWNKAVKLDKRYKAKYPGNYMLVKYEDLLKDHKATVQKVCLFLNIDFTETMLNPPVVDTSFTNTGGETHKEKNFIFSKGFNRLMDSLLNSKLKRYNYN